MIQTEAPNSPRRGYAGKQSPSFHNEYSPPHTNRSSGSRAQKQEEKEYGLFEIVSIHFFMTKSATICGLDCSLLSVS